MMMMNQIQRTILSIVVVLLLFVSTTVTNGAGNATCETELKAYEVCFKASSCTCAATTFNASKYNTSIADGNCASILDASCEVQACCSNCTTVISQYFGCVFTSKFTDQTCESNCQKKTYQVRGSNAIMTTFTKSTIIITIGSILMASFVL